MPAIEGGLSAVGNARRLVDAAALLGVAVPLTEQNPAGLGHRSGARAPQAAIRKMTFDAVRAPGFLDGLPAEGAVVVAGCEAHVCVLQTVPGQAGARAA